MEAHILLNMPTVDLDTVRRLGQKHLNEDLDPETATPEQAKAYLNRLCDHLHGRLAAYDELHQALDEDDRRQAPEELIRRAHQTASDEFMALVSGR